MHIAIKAKTALSDTPNKISTQQERYPLMLFEYNGTLQKWHMTNSPPEIDTHRKWCLAKMVYLVKKRVQSLYAQG